MTMTQTLEEIERAILGACMIEGAGFPMASKIISSEAFSIQAHRLMFEAMERLASIGRPIDILTVTQSLREAGALDKAGGSLYVTQCTSRINQASNIEAHALVVKEAHIKREMFKAGNTLASFAGDDTVRASDALGDTLTHLMSLLGKASKTEPVTAGEALEAFKEDLFAKSNSVGGISGIRTGVRELDRALGGLNPKLIIVAGRPGMGKSTLPIRALVECARSGKTAMLFSLEMGKAEVGGRILANISGVPVSRMMHAVGHEASNINSAIEELKGLPILIDTTPAIKVPELRAKVLRAHAERPVGLVVVDYIQLMGTAKERGKSREQEVSELSSFLKALQMEVNCPVVALSQLSRNVEQRGGDKRPMLSDLRESGSIEQDADIVLFLYRPDYYGITEDEAGNSIEGLCEIIIAKFRGGKAPCIVNALANFPAFRFEDWGATDVLPEYF